MLLFKKKRNNTELSSFIADFISRKSTLCSRGGEDRSQHYGAACLCLAFNIFMGLSFKKKSRKWVFENSLLTDVHLYEMMQCGIPLLWVNLWLNANCQTVLFATCPGRLSLAEKNKLIKHVRKWHFCVGTFMCQENKITKWDYILFCKQIKDATNKSIPQ